MKIINGFIIAFSMYSRIPMPRADWNGDNMKYSISFLPFVGIVIGLLVIGLRYLCEVFDFNNIVFAAVAASLPILITGGIHMDGFCDTSDALASHQSKERKLEIMKDSHAGAFAIIKSVIYFLLYFALLTQISVKGIWILGLGYVLSRTLAGISVVNFKCAKTSGLASVFNEMTSRKNVTWILLTILVLVLLGMMAVNYITTLVSGIFAVLTFIYYKYMAYREFGGITGDTTGYFLQICELNICFAIIITEGVLRSWS